MYTILGFGLATIILGIVIGKLWKLFTDYFQWK